MSDNKNSTKDVLLYVGIALLVLSAFTLVVYSFVDSNWMMYVVIGLFVGGITLLLVRYR